MAKALKCNDLIPIVLLKQGRESSKEGCGTQKDDS